MKKILLTTFIALALGSAAVAQQEPAKANVTAKKFTKSKAERQTEQAKLQKYKAEAEKASQQATAPKTKASLAADKATDAAKH